MKNNIQGYLFLLIIFAFVVKIHGQDLSRGQHLLDSILRLDPLPYDRFEYSIDTIIPLNNGFNVMVVNIYYDCYGDICTTTGYGLISPKGDTLQPVFDDIVQLTNNEIILNRPEKVLQINTDMRVTKVYDHFGEFIRGFAVFSKNGLYGLCNKSGEVILPPVYDYLEGIDGLDRIAVRRAENWTILHIEDLVPDEKRDIEKDWGFTEESIELIKVQNPQSRLWALLNKKGIQVTPYKYEEITTFYGGNAIGQIDYYWGLIGNQGEELSEFKYDQIYYDTFGSTYIVSQGFIITKCGLLSDTGVELAPLKYSTISTEPIFSDRLDGLYWIVRELKGGWGLLDNKGKAITDMIYKEIDVKNYDNPKGLLDEVWEELFKK